MIKRTIKKALVRHLAGRNVVCASFPQFMGKWPMFDVSGKLIIGQGCQFRTFRLKSSFSVDETGLLEFGDQVFVNDGVNICARRSVKIGSHVKIGDQVTIYDTYFHQIEPGKDAFSAAVEIGRNVWIGSHAVILPGVRIGDHSVIGAASIVTADVPPKSIVAGSPARVIRTLECPNDWIRP
jgi:acetyltransferase-like isoleucine patch superfamily enzyme